MAGAFICLTTWTSVTAGAPPNTYKAIGGTMLAARPIPAIAISAANPLKNNATNFLLFSVFSSFAIGISATMSPRLNVRYSPNEVNTAISKQSLIILIAGAASTKSRTNTGGTNKKPTTIAQRK